MKRGALQNAEKYTKAHQKKKRWYKAVTCLACIVVFCTVYALILPAITLENPNCSIPEHIHTQECYEQVTSIQKRIPVCSKETLQIHQHTRDCYDGDGVLSCGYADFVAHHHDAACYNSDGTLWCPLPEIAPHRHTASCYAQPEAASATHTHGSECYATSRGALICTEHVHTDDCYRLVSVLTCTEDHDHGESCYETQRELVCGIDSNHQHTDACYEQIETLVCDLPTEEAQTEPEPKLICGKEEVILHEHTPDCFDTDGKLICGRLQVLEHQHTDSCFETTEQPVDTGALTCTLPEDENHTHGPRCYGAWVLSCGLEEHIHDGSCTAAPGEAATYPVSLYTDESRVTPLDTELQITVTGVLPEDAQVVAYPVEVELDGQEVLFAYDISIYLADGSLYEPEGGLTVQFSSDAFALTPENSVYYVPEDGEPQKINSTQEENSVSFETDHFSVYAVATPAESVAGNGEKYWLQSFGINGFPHPTNRFLTYEAGYAFNSATATEFKIPWLWALGDTFGTYSDLYKNVPWRGDGSDNYEVCYCAAPGDAGEAANNSESFYTRTALAADSTITSDQQQKLQRIIAHAYPYISIEELTTQLNAHYGAQNSYTSQDLITGIQASIWTVLSNNDDRPVSLRSSEHTYEVKSSTGSEAPFTVEHIPNNDSVARVQEVYDYMMAMADSAGTGSAELSIADTHLVKTPNEDGTQSIQLTVTLDRDVTADEGITATVTYGDNQSVTVPVSTENRQFIVSIPSVDPNASSLHLKLDGIQSYSAEVYVYNANYKNSHGSWSQRMINGRVTSCAAGLEKDIPLLERGEKEIRVEKAWAGLPEGETPPEQVLVQLCGGEQSIGEKIALSAENEWKYTWTNLPDKNAAGEEIQYTVKEDPVEGFDCVVSGDMDAGFVITNTKYETASISVEKKWAGTPPEGGNPSQVEVQLLANEEPFGEPVALSAENNWMYLWEGLRKFDSGHNAIHYTVRELRLPGYDVSIEVGEPPAGGSVTWEPATDFANGETYLIIAGGQAFTGHRDGRLTGTAVDTGTFAGVTDDMLWTASQSGSAFTLQNVGVGAPLARSGNWFTTNAGVPDGGKIDGTLFYIYGDAFTGRKLRANNISIYFSSFNANGYGATVKSLPSGADITLYKRVTDGSSEPVVDSDIHYVITNTYTGRTEEYELPDTGGAGTAMYTTGGLMLTGMGFILLYSHIKRRKGDSASS